MDLTTVIDSLEGLTKDEALLLIAVIEKKVGLGPCLVRGVADPNADQPCPESDELPTETEIEEYGNDSAEFLNSYYSKLQRSIRRSYGTPHCGVLMAEQERFYITLRHLRGYCCPSCASKATRKHYSERVCNDCGHRADRGLFLGLVYDRGY